MSASGQDRKPVHGRVSAHHPTEPFLAGIPNGRYGAKSSRSIALARVAAVEGSSSDTLPASFFVSGFGNVPQTRTRFLKAPLDFHTPVHATRIFPE